MFVDFVLDAAEYDVWLDSNDFNHRTIGDNAVLWNFVSRLVETVACHRRIPDPDWCCRFNAIQLNCMVMNAAILAT